LKFKHDFHDKFKHHEKHQQYVHGKDNDGNQNMCAGINVINLIDQQTAPGGQLKKKKRMLAPPIQKGKPQKHSRTTHQRVNQITNRLEISS